MELEGLQILTAYPIVARMWQRRRPVSLSVVASTEELCSRAATWRPHLVLCDGAILPAAVRRLRAVMPLDALLVGVADAPEAIPDLEELDGAVARRGLEQELAEVLATCRTFRVIHPSGAIDASRAVTAPVMPRSAVVDLSRVTAFPREGEERWRELVRTLSVNQPVQVRRVSPAAEAAFAREPTLLANCTAMFEPTLAAVS